LAANFERLVPISSRLLANADGQHRAHARFPGAAQHRFAVIRVAFAVQVSVGINQHCR
jgi:hypothetical protein